MGNKILLAAIILVTLLIRAYNIETIPTWNWDEGVNLNIASNLADGKSQQFALKYTWVPHPPLYFLVLTPILKVSETSLNTIIALRLLSIAYSIGTVLLIYLIGRQIKDEKTGLTAALFYSLYPAAVFWNRMGLAHNQLMLLAVLTLYALLKHQDSGNTRFLYLACLTAFLCFITEYAGAAFIAALLIYIHVHYRGELKRVLLVSTVLLFAYLTLMIFLYGMWFIQDLWFNFGRVNLVALILALVLIGVLIVNQQKLKNILEWLHFEMDKVGVNVFLFYMPLTSLALLIPPSDETLLDAINYFWVVGVIGFLFIEKEEKRDVTWMFYFSYLGVLAAYDRADHMVLPLYPLLSIGAAIFLLKLFYSRDRIFSFMQGKANPLLITATALILIFYPIVVLAYQDIDGFILGHNFRAMPIAEAEKLNNFINGRTKPGDVVLTQSYFSQGVKCKTTILLHAVSYDGKPIAYYPILSPERFAYNTSIRSVRYAVLPKGVVEELNQSGYGEAAGELSRWPVLYETNTSEEVGVPKVYSLINRIKGINYESQTLIFQVRENPDRSPTI